MFFLIYNLSLKYEPFDRTIRSVLLTIFFREKTLNYCSLSFYIVKVVHIMNLICSIFITNICYVFVIETQII